MAHAIYEIEARTAENLSKALLKLLGNSVVSKADTHGVASIVDSVEGRDRGVRGLLHQSRLDLEGRSTCVC
jgi:hypothetical protein